MRFNDPQFAREYESKLADENYPGSLYTHVVRELAGCETVIDVGAGTGFFALPLAKEGKQVTAVEPSPVMIGIMKSKITPGIKKNILIEQCAWEQWDGPASEGLICMHSIYGMDDIPAALKKMKEKSHRSLVMVRAARGRRTISEVLRRHLVQTATAPDYPSLIKKALSKFEYHFTETLIEETKIIRIQDLDREADFYSHQIFKNREHKAEIIRLIAAESENKGGTYRFTALHRDHFFVF
ncbi:MAG TPA: class I SAM-dependent methyltransferase [Spirochaetota bacterium]|nr:class I SAM-dependent methyltransferase [Spirochaetota bacterium]HPI89540.1 class I SAM-dependent methyltransferase [Spirochaetota bacterium]HPR49004.1 class I SAM-dependent methyltransferase [Spirochaetota bacterium]